jgi:hypothetical protein
MQEIYGALVGLGCSENIIICSTAFRNLLIKVRGVRTSAMKGVESGQCYETCLFHVMRVSHVSYVSH